MDVWTGSLAAWEWVMGVNFWGVVHGMRTFLPHFVMNGGGYVVNTASIAGLLPGFSAPYDASKHAVVAVSEHFFNSDARRRPASPHQHPLPGMGSHGDPRLGPQLADGVR